MNLSIVKKLDNFIDPLRSFSERFLSPVLLLIIRVFTANLFIWSGWAKFKNFLNGDWASTLYLFREIHPLPGLPPEMAAVMGTAGELVFPVLLALGLFARLGAAGLLAMTAAIQFLIPAQYGMANPDHYMWMLLLAVIFVKGPGLLSADHLIQRLLVRR